MPACLRRDHANLLCMKTKIEAKFGRCFSPRIGRGVRPGSKEGHGKGPPCHDSGSHPRRQSRQITTAKKMLATTSKKMSPSTTTSKPRKFYPTPSRDPRPLLAKGNDATLAETSTTLRLLKIDGNGGPCGRDTRRTGRVPSGVAAGKGV